VWIYREDRKLLACPGAAEGCSAVDGSVIARVKIDRGGAYTLVALSSSNPLPEATDSFDQSMAAAERANADRRIEQRVVQ
jgi:hypothetical protein